METINSNEKNLEKSSKLFDNQIGDYANQIANKISKDSLIDKFVKLPGVDELSKHSLFQKINNWFVTNFSMIILILGWLSLIGGVLGVISSLGLFAIFTNDFISFNYKIYLLIINIGLLLMSLLSLLIGIGLLRKSKWIPALTVLDYFFIIVYYLVEIVLFYGLKGTFKINVNIMGYSNSFAHSVVGPNFISIIIGILLMTVFTLLIVKNKSQFNK